MKNFTNARLEGLQPWKAHWDFYNHLHSSVEHENKYKKMHWMDYEREAEFKVIQSILNIVQWTEDGNIRRWFGGIQSLPKVSRLQHQVMRHFVWWKWAVRSVRCTWNLDKLKFAVSEILLPLHRYRLPPLSTCEWLLLSSTFLPFSQNQCSIQSSQPILLPILG